MRPMRPRFRLELPYGRNELRMRLDAHLACEGCPCAAVFSDHHIDVHVARRHRNYWSPQLNLEVEEDASGRVVLNGLYGPAPNVWTMFLAGYASLGFIALFGLMFGISQWVIDTPPWALLAVPIAACVALIGYIASLVGQRLAAEQMELLRCFLQSSLGITHEPIVAPECPPEASERAADEVVVLGTPGVTEA
jgi:hypothetical protein